MPTRAASFEELRGAFRWRIPARYNIGVDVCDRQPPDAVALIADDGAGGVVRHTFGEIRRLSNRLANTLAAQGVGRGDRVAILLAQSLETAVAHVAAYKLGAIALPLFTLFGEDALLYRLEDSGARALITDHANLAKIEPLRDRLPALSTVLAVGGGPGALDFHDRLGRASDQFVPVDTAADDPALIIYTSGTTGNPKGALHAHRVLLGHLPGVELPHEFFPQEGDLFWTPADWAWIGGLIDVLLPAWHHGVPVLAHRARKFDPGEAMALMARHTVRNVFMPPTALKLMRQAGIGRRPDVALRSIGSGGETLGEELLSWGRDTFGLTINEFYGQTECNLVIGNCAGLMPVRPGAMGRAIPGHEVAVIDASGAPLPPGQSGEIAVRRGDPVMFLEYWNRPEATAAKFQGDWLATGDTGRVDEDGYFWFEGRADDVITSAGYRIGPAEIEDCLMKHPAVAMAAAVGVPDRLRTELVKAFIVPRPGFVPSDRLAAEIQAFVKARLAAHEYPRLVEFVDELPMTPTGKIRRRDLRDRAQLDRDIHSG
ncbi:MAG: acyl-CoA synthetase [Alphaproteobacteria bacterium]|nr:acyl-CoA synthetase [Alphaproteobacteria bacterium]